MGARVKEEPLGGGLSESLESRSKYLSSLGLQLSACAEWPMTWTLAVHPTPRGSPWVRVALVGVLRREEGRWENWALPFP